MGLAMSITNFIPGLSSQGVISLALRQLGKPFEGRNINNFEQFHIAVLDTFKLINSTIPGKHFEVPEKEDIEKLFPKWKAEENPQQKTKLLEDFLQGKINLRKPNNSTIYTGLVVPPAAMAAKRAAEPTLNFVKVVPDVVFVPSITVLALFSVNLGQKILGQKLPHKP